MIRLLAAGLLLTLATMPAPPPASAAAAAIETKPSLANTERPDISGTARQGRVLRAFPGRWSPTRTETRYHWLRDGEPVRGARHRHFRLGPLDVGARISVAVRVRAEGYAWTTVTSRPTRRVSYATAVRRRVTYSVSRRGPVTASLREFARLAQETYDDARGWRAGGIEFRRVRRGGSFTLVLATAGAVPAFSSSCSSMWSCRVGRFVIINQDRWRSASPAWNRAGRSLRDYRHMVVNHETGHWLGRGHAGCPRGGGPAPVMMQQSKGTGACHFNPWPLPRER